MNKRYLPYIALILAALFFFWVRSHQRGPGVTSEKAIDAYTTLRGGNKILVYSRHAQCRMACRHIDSTEVREILNDGIVNFNKIEHGDKGPSYPLEGTTPEGEHVRIVFAPHGDDIVVVTAIDLDKDWPCDCGDNG